VIDKESSETVAETVVEADKEFLANVAGIGYLCKCCRV
jgi:hypothetical protein